MSQRIETPVTPLEILFIIAQLIFLEGILSIDNAAVLGAMVSHLPVDQPVPWPRGWRHFGRTMQPLVGNQRAAALKVGLLGAYIGRGLMLLFATVIVANPWLRLVGAIYLIKIAVAHLGRLPGDRSVDHQTAHALSDVAQKAFWATVVSVELADLAFSLDNVVAAVSLSTEFWVIMIGVALGIITMRFAATLFTVLIEREPVLVPAAFLLILNIGLETAAAEIFGVEIGIWLKFGISLLTLLLAVAYARWRPLRIMRPVVHALRAVCYRLNQGFDFLLKPITLAWASLIAMVAVTRGGR